MRPWTYPYTGNILSMRERASERKSRLPAERWLGFPLRRAHQLRLKLPHSGVLANRECLTLNHNIRLQLRTRHTRLGCIMSDGLPWIMTAGEMAGLSSFLCSLRLQNHRGYAAEASTNLMCRRFRSSTICSHGGCQWPNTRCLRYM